MYFRDQERVFSLGEVVASPPSRNLTTLFEEFYGLLLIAGFLEEASQSCDVIPECCQLSNKDFYLSAGSYSQAIADMVSKGLRSRFVALRTHSSINAHELSVLALVDRLFQADKDFTIGLKGDDLFGIAIARQFSPAMQSVARYVAVMFGRSQFPTPVEVPGLYLSILGDIHLTLEKTTTLEIPELPYGSRYDGRTRVTALWALVSAQITSLSKSYRPGDVLGEYLAGFLLLANPCDQTRGITVPRYAASLYMQQILGIEGYEKVPVTAAFYQSFLYGSCEEQVLSRCDLLCGVLDLMVKKAGDSDFELFAPHSSYRKLRSRSFFSGKAPTRPAILQFALEALDPTDEVSDDTANVDDTSTETQTDDSEYDPTNPSPNTSEAEPAGSVNTIGLISFDKSGEGVDEHLYRNAVVALNDRLRDDDTLPVTVEVREALDYWVSGFLYLTSIASTKDYMVALKLQKYLKDFNTRKNDQ